MHILLHKIEKIIDKLIPICLIILVPVITIELFFSDIAHNYYIVVFAIDAFVIFIFFIDLIFKYIRMRNVKKFLRSYWLEIIAILPFYTIFRVVDEIALLTNPAVTQSVQSSQKIVREGLQLEKEGARIVKEAGSTSRYNRFFNFTIGRSRTITRLVRVIPFFEKPTGKHHPRDKKK